MRVAFALVLLSGATPKIKRKQEILVVKKYENKLILENQAMEDLKKKEYSP